MNGAQPFVYLCAASTPKGREKDKGKAKTITTDPSDAELELCPQCVNIEGVVLLNPSQDEEDVKRETMERKRCLELVKEAEERLAHGRRRASSEETPSMKISAASQAAVSGLAMEEAKRKDERCCKELVWEWDDEEDDFHYYGHLHYNPLFVHHHHQTNYFLKQATKPPPLSADGPRRRHFKLHDLHPAKAETAESVSAMTVSPPRRSSW